VFTEEIFDFGVIVHMCEGEGIFAFPIGAFGADEGVGTEFDEKFDGGEVALAGGDVKGLAAMLGVNFRAVVDGDLDEFDFAGPAELDEKERGFGAVLEKEFDHLGVIDVRAELDAVGAFGVDLFGMSGEVGIDGAGEAQGAGHEEIGLYAAGEEVLEDVDFSGVSGGALGGFIAGLGSECVHGFDEVGARFEDGLNGGEVQMAGRDQAGLVDQRFGFIVSH